MPLCPSLQTYFKRRDGGAMLVLFWRLSLQMLEGTRSRSVNVCLAFPSQCPSETLSHTSFRSLSSEQASRGTVPTLFILIFHPCIYFVFEERGHACRGKVWRAEDKLQESPLLSAPWVPRVRLPLSVSARSAFTTVLLCNSYCVTELLSSSRRQLSKQSS